MSVVWPAELPQAPLVGYKDVPQSRSIRTNMDAGEPKSRPVTTKQLTNMSWEFYLTLDQKVILKSFYNESCIGGSEKFEFPHPDDDSPIQCEFLSAPTYISMGAGRYRCSFDVLVSG